MRFKIFKKCEECKKKTKSFRICKGKMICYSCYQKKVKIIGIGNGRHSMTLNEALNKTYKITGYLRPSGTLYNIIYLPPVLIGKKVKLILVK